MGETEKTRLVHLMLDNNVSMKKLREVMRVSSQMTVYNKVHKINDFTLTEAKAIQEELFPDYSIEYIFDGYGFVD